MESFLPCDFTSQQNPWFFLFCSLQLWRASELPQLNVTTEHPELTMLPLSRKKGTTREGKHKWKKLKILFYMPLAIALVWTQRCPCQPAHLSSLLPPLCIWALQHIHLRFPFQLLIPNSSCLICYIIKFCCAGKYTSRLLLCWININAKTNSAGTFPLPWSHLSW